MRYDCQPYFFLFVAYNEFPRNVFITHNHLDHAGELPMLFVYESKRRYQAREPRLRVLSGPEVEHKLKTHRLDEMLSLYKPVSEVALCSALLSTALRGYRHLTSRQRDLFEIWEEELALVTAVILSTHVQKPVLNFSACVRQTTTRIFFVPVFDFAKTESSDWSTLAENARALGAKSGF